MRTLRKRLLPILAITGTMAALAGCNTLDEQLGLGKHPPDEFRVVARAPLSIPPQFQLRPPAPGAERPQEGTARQQAETAVFTEEGEQGSGSRIEGDTGLSEGERTLLARAGANEAPSDIREVVNCEAQNIRDANESLLQDLLFWQETQPPGTVVDAEAESKRIRENQALGDDVAKGESPTIERRQRGFLEGVF